MLVLTSCALAVTAARVMQAQAQVPPEALSVYSDVCIHPESGDLIGDRLIIIRTLPFPEDPPYMLLQRTGGLLWEPERVIPTIDGNKLSFLAKSYDNGAMTRRFVGTVTPDLLTGSFEDTRTELKIPAQVIRLKRSQLLLKFDECK